MTTITELCNICPILKKTPAVATKKDLYGTCYCDTDDCKIELAEINMASGVVIDKIAGLTTFNIQKQIISSLIASLTMFKLKTNYQDKIKLITPFVEIMASKLTEKTKFIREEIKIKPIDKTCYLCKYTEYVSKCDKCDQMTCRECLTGGTDDYFGRPDKYFCKKCDPYYKE